ncbi:glucan biosynthesis protein D [Verticiella sediminum]|uniref:Glucan biosynthesis protein D n=1 Tax=Verticiella sediminum TaxID=1247510 RepID=A0A556AYZ5_9BURK|nr:glucan biosynthesis protein D [Verticiella sediminum]TSH98164.1 glucan biosynthesis protein D [Verticiella sediminum]
MIDRRRFLATAAATTTLASAGIRPALAAEQLTLGAAKPFSFDALREQAQALAGKPYEPPTDLPRDVLERIDYDAHGKIRFKPDLALFADGPGQFPVTFFHLGRFFQIPVHMYVLDGQQAREIVYDENYFDMPKDSPARALPKGSGFAGFRFQESRLGDKDAPDWRGNDWVAFLGASYFRAIGELYQYGLSARGVAIDPAVGGKPEEFPTFTRFYFEPPKPGSDAVTVYALLEGQSLTGAYRFVMQRGRWVDMQIESSLFLRQDIERLGLAPLTSMYWFSENNKPGAIDIRPEVHDSDGLALWTSGGEHLWRPLNNPPHTTVSSFGDSAPRGFGLLQRDRNFDHYMDGVHYERRPSLWVEPVSDWGKGAVQLIEIRTDDEIHDNIVAMWVRAEPARKGERIDLDYKLYWRADEPFPSPLGRCVATRQGNGGQPGQPRPENVRKFMVEFLGGPLADLPYGTKPEAVLWASRGEFSYVFTEAVPNDVAGHWRAQFDFHVTDDEPVEMRLFLRADDKPLTETWAYQYLPSQAVRQG